MNRLYSLIPDTSKWRVDIKIRVHGGKKNQKPSLVWTAPEALTARKEKKRLSFENKRDLSRFIY